VSSVEAGGILPGEEGRLTGSALGKSLHPHERIKRDGEACQKSGGG